MADVSELIAALSSAQAPQRVAAAEALSRLGVDARPAAVPLVRLAGANRDEERELAAAALEELGPPSAEDAPSLVELIEVESPDAAYWAVTLLGRLKEKASKYVPAVAAALEPPHALPVRQRAAWALGEIGPAAKTSLPALEKAAADADPRLSRLAKQSMAKIRGS